MATAKTLMALGMPADVAIRIGYQETTVATSTATQGTGGGLLRGPGNRIVTATFTTAADSITLPTASEIGDEILISNVSANAGVVFPPTGGNINGETANENVAMAAQGGAGSIQRFLKVSSTRWSSMLNIAAD